MLSSYRVVHDESHRLCHVHVCLMLPSHAAHCAAEFSALLWLFPSALCTQPLCAASTHPILYAGVHVSVSASPRLHTAPRTVATLHSAQRPLTRHPSPLLLPSPHHEQRLRRLQCTRQAVEAASATATKACAVKQLAGHARCRRRGGIFQLLLLGSPCAHALCSGSTIQS